MTTVPLRLFHCSSFVSVASDTLHNKLQECTVVTYVVDPCLNEIVGYAVIIYLNPPRPVRARDIAA